jgi:hypothetical protein
MHAIVDHVCTYISHCEDMGLVFSVLTGYQIEY